ncbi:hard surface induced protein 3 [Colletotrichum truncatum]|uniref:Hard surface induced protein 3 n=1 Tax=Colletotrichum truncatum TaxID=5467 RepID=A0ACC3YVQ7_COLTU|nr:hard surface induced protein 3 [Colletotrichum truncatum]KAF6791261.1 hard surface induced protein 3 [Colletotrichum truncatum]
MAMLPSFLQPRNDSDDTDGRYPYNPLGDFDSSEEFKPLVDETEDDSISEAEDSLLPINTRRRDALTRFLRALSFLVPSFLGPKENKAKPLRPTAWLDGLRGIAALCVVLVHIGLACFSWDILLAWSPNSPRRWWLYQLPILRLVVSGLAPVCVFFVVSGYTISHHFLTLARRGEFEKAGSAIASSVFRRHTRLFLPVAVVSFVTAIMTYLNLFPDQGLPGVVYPTRVPPHFDSLWRQLQHYILAEIITTDPIGQLHVRADSDVPEPIYDPHLWTIPLEFMSSMVVFMFLTAFTRVHNKVRMLFALSLAIYLQLVFVYWGMFLFLSGMFLCDLHFELEGRQWRWASLRSEPQYRATSPLDRVVRSKRGSTPYRVLGRGVGLVSFLTSLWLLSMPEDMEQAAQAPGYATLVSWVPERFQEVLVIPIGAVLTVLVVDQATFLQILFTNRFSQYMGKISFSLYMIHGPLLYSLGLVIARWTVGLVGGGDSEISYIFGILLAFILWAPVAIYVADLTTTFVDAKAIEFSKWAYDMLLRKE